MGRYSIKDLEKLSGIKSHTIRIWEKRYDLLKTKRTETNIRYYDDEDLKYILNVAYLVNHGLKISRVATLTSKELADKIKELSDQESDYEYEINSFISVMTDFDEIQFEKIISNCSIKYGMEESIKEIIYPFLHRIGIMWQTGSINPAQEHFISNLIRQKLIIAIDALAIRYNSDTTRFLLFLPEGELHEIPLLVANYITRKRGHHTLYLGQTVPLSDLQSVYQFYQPHYLFSIITDNYAKEDLQNYLNDLSEKFRSSVILISGNAVRYIHEKDYPQNIRFLRDVNETINFMDSIPNPPASK